MNLTTLKYYDELTPAAQEQARLNIVVPEIAGHKARIEKAKLDFIAHMHKQINDRFHIRRIFNGSTALQKIKQQGDHYLLRYVRDNLSIFTEEGAYVFYLGHFSMILEGREYIPTPNQQKALTAAYIAINERGPAFHKQLFAQLKIRGRKW